MGTQANDMIRSHSQRMAAYAWVKTKEALSKEFVQLAKGAPALVMANGLMQALAFWQSREKEGGTALVRTIADWILREAGMENKDSSISQDLFGRVMRYLYESSSSDFARATRESLELLRWIKQFASAMSKES
ncbi:MAG: type III-B CRISPR module-associated protein Cmr5 [Thermodesulfobacteriota bacterium]